MIQFHSNRKRLFSRFIFSLKLAVTPQPRNGNEPIGVSSSQNIAIKVEGVISTTTTLAKPLRSVKAIKLALTSQLSNASKPIQSDGLSLKTPDCNQSLEQVAEPHNDFFSGQFLLPFPVAGTHQVKIFKYLDNQIPRLWALISNLLLGIDRN